MADQAVYNARKIERGVIGRKVCNAKMMMRQGFPMRSAAAIVGFKPVTLDRYLWMTIGLNDPEIQAGSWFRAAQGPVPK